jgi:hypothetical protein
VTAVGVVDPEDSDDTATDSTEIALDGTIVFVDGFESGDVSAWTTAVP